MIVAADSMPTDKRIVPPVIPSDCARLCRQAAMAGRFGMAERRAQFAQRRAKGNLVDAAMNERAAAERRPRA